MNWRFKDLSLRLFTVAFTFSEDFNIWFNSISLVLKVSRVFMGDLDDVMSIIPRSMFISFVCKFLIRRAWLF